MTTTAHEGQFTDAPEPVIQPYSTTVILRRNVADLEIALRKQTERAEAAEAELARLWGQEPVAWKYKDESWFDGNHWHDSYAVTVSYATAIFKHKDAVPLFAAPVPVPAPAAPDANPVQWLEDEGDNILVPRGLLGAACSSIDNQRQAQKVLEALRYYTMNAPQAPAVPEEFMDAETLEGVLAWLETQEQTVNIGPVRCEMDEHLESSAGWLTRLVRALLQSAEGYSSQAQNEVRHD